MKNKLYILLLLILTQYQVSGQKGAKIGYINMEYILEKMPEYAEANTQLENNISSWKKEIDKKKNEIDKLKKQLEAEKPLLTNELIEDTQEEIKYLESELFDYQQNIFGPNGVMTNQKNNLVKPIQDQVFNVIQDIAEAKKYDFIFDKTSDLTMLYASKRYDISDYVLRWIQRASKKQNLSDKKLKQIAAEELKESNEEENPALDEKRKRAEELKAKREKLLADRKKLVEDRQREKEERRQQLLDEKEARKNNN